MTPGKLTREQNVKPREFLHCTAISRHFKFSHEDNFPSTTSPKSGSKYGQKTVNKYSVFNRNFTLTSDKSIQRIVVTLSSAKLASYFVVV